jgi:hypothetical protein
MKARCVLVILALLICQLAVGADNFNKAGRTAMQFVKIGIGARQTALGEAGIVSVRDVNSMFWNPAAISGIQSTEASFSFNRWFADMNYYAGAAGVRLSNIGIVSLGFASLDYGNIQEALVKTGSGSSDTRTGGSFSGKDLMAGLSFSHEFTDRLSIGVTAKYLQEKLFVYSSSLVAFDVGTYYDTGFKGIKFGMSFQNFGKSVKFLDQSDREEGYDIPLIFRVGASLDLLNTGDAFFDAGPNHKLTLSFEALNTNDFGERYHVGGEYTLLGFLALRGGYRFNYDQGNLSLGVGLQQSISDLNVRVDYSFVNYTYLESPHRISLTIAY